MKTNVGIQNKNHTEVFLLWRTQFAKKAKLSLRASIVVVATIQNEILTFFHAVGGLRHSLSRARRLDALRIISSVRK